MLRNCSNIFHKTVQMYLKTGSQNVIFPFRKFTVLPLLSTFLGQAFPLKKTPHDLRLSCRRFPTITSLLLLFFLSLSLSAQCPPPILSFPVIASGSSTAQKRCISVYCPNRCTHHIVLPKSSSGGSDPPPPPPPPPPTPPPPPPPPSPPADRLGHEKEEEKVAKSK